MWHAEARAAQQSSNASAAGGGLTAEQVKSVGHTFTFKGKSSRTQDNRNDDLGGAGVALSWGVFFVADGGACLPVGSLLVPDCLASDSLAEEPDFTLDEGGDDFCGDSLATDLAEALLTGADC